MDDLQLRFNVLLCDSLTAALMPIGMQSSTTIKFGLTFLMLPLPAYIWTVSLFHTVFAFVMSHVECLPNQSG